MEYEFAIIGAGVSGIFAAHALAGNSRSIVMIDKGKKLEERSCPQDVGEACDCQSCDKYVGFGGLGLSEGKYNYTNDFGGDLEEKVGYPQALQLMDEVDSILCSYGGHNAELYDTNHPELTQKAEKFGFHVLTTRTRHLGTALSRTVLQGIYGFLERRVDWRFQTEVIAIHRRENGGFTLVMPDGEAIQAGKVIIATGRSGNEWLSRQCDLLGLELSRARVDLGLRIEMRGDQLNPILNQTLETKLRFQGHGYTATTYCMNPQGRVVFKHQEGLTMPDGQNYREHGEGTPNLNFSLFVPLIFPTLEQADRYLREIVGGINQGRGRIAVQRLHDLRGGRSSIDTEGQQAKHTITPTLNAEFAELSREVPELYIRAALEFLQALEGLLGEPIDGDTLLYAIDGKLYSPGILTDHHFETPVQGVYVIGDCSGTTHSLSQAAASGLYVGQTLSYT